MTRILPACALAWLAALTLSACAEPAEDTALTREQQLGSLALQLVAGPELVLDTIAYTIVGQAFQRDGSFDVQGPGASFSAYLSDIPAGLGHQITLTSAARGDAGVVCSATASFDVAARQTTNLVVVLLCDSPDDTGAASINGAFNVCPSVRATSVTPTLQAVNETIHFMLTARDLDQQPEPLRYQWTSPQGPVENATSPTPSFLCTRSGPVTLLYTISDGACTQTGSLSAACADVDAGPEDAGTGDAGDAGTSARIVINEIESNNGTPGDWIELYNPNDAAVDLTGFTLRDDDDTHTFSIAAGTLLAAGGYLVVDESQLGFGLGAGDAARLFDASGRLHDAHIWSQHASTTYARCPNGEGPFALSASPTKGSANLCPAPPAQGVILNEIESNNGVPGDWIELYNQTSSTVELAGFSLRDDDDTHSYVFPSGSTIAPGAYLVVEEASLRFGLGSADAVRLFGSSATLLDSYVWTSHAATTYGRCPSGVGPFAVTATPTKGAANACAAPPALPAIVFNEIESSDAQGSDWIELYNVGSAAIDLSGFVFRDNDDTHIFVLPPGSVVPARGYLVFDDTAFNFGLGSADVVRLYLPNGATLVDSFAWTSHAATTYGRCPDGTGSLQTTSNATPGSANACLAL